MNNNGRAVTRCLNCSNEYSGNYCSNCGQKKDIKRFAVPNLSNEFIHGFFHFHKGLLFTIKELFVRPGSMIAEYLEGKRVNYFNPFTFLVLVSIVGGFFHSHSGLIDYADSSLMSTPEAIEFTSKHFSVRVLIAIPIYALLGRIFFWKSNYNFAEHLVANTYILNQVVVIYTILFILLTVFSFGEKGYSNIRIAMEVTGVVYPLIAYLQLFNKSKIVIRFLKSITVIVAALIINFYAANALIKFFISIVN